MRPKEIRPGRHYQFDNGKIYRVFQVEYLNYRNCRKYDVVDYFDEEGFTGSMPLHEFARRSQFEISVERKK